MGQLLLNYLNSGNNRDTNYNSLGRKEINYQHMACLLFDQNVNSNIELSVDDL